MYVFMFFFICSLCLRLRLRFRLCFRICFRFRCRYHSRLRFRIRFRVCFQSFVPDSFSFGLPISSRESGLRSACLLSSKLGKWLDRSHLPSVGGPGILASGLALRWRAGLAPVTRCRFPRQSRPEAQMTHVGSKSRINCPCNAVVGVPPLG